MVTCRCHPESWLSENGKSGAIKLQIQRQGAVRQHAIHVHIAFFSSSTWVCGKGMQLTLMQLVGGCFSHPFEKYAKVKLDHFRR